MDRACRGYSSAHRPVMNTVAGTFSSRSAAISPGLSNRSPCAARGPWSAVMSASKVSATLRPAPRGPCSKTGVMPAGPGARVGGFAPGEVALGAGCGARLVSCAPHAASALRAESVENIGVLVEGAPALTVVVPNGRVRVAAGKAGRVAAVVTRRALGPDRGAAQAALDNLSVVVFQLPAGR